MKINGQNDQKDCSKGTRFFTQLSDLKKVPYLFLTSRSKITSKIAFSSFHFIAAMLLKSFCKHQFGVFEEEGFLHDSLYPLTFVDGNKTVANRGCSLDNVTLLHEFCPLGQVYDRYAPTKQNLLCSGSSAFDVILSHANFQVIDSLISSIDSHVNF